MTFELGTDIWLWLDPSQACNIACALCYTRPSHSQNFLTPSDAELFCSKIVQSGVTIREITLNWRGEPLMNKMFPDILAIVLKYFPSTRVQFHTNAMLLGNRVAESLCRIRQPYHVYLSIDGGNEQAHDSNRGKDSFRRAVRGGHCLLRHRGESAWPHVSLYQLDLGVDEATYDAEFLNLAAQCDVWQRVTPIVANGSDPTYNDSLDPTLHWQADARGPQPNGACFWAGYSLSVSPTGDVSPCILTQIANPEALLGNLRNDSMDAIIGRASAFRERLEIDGRQSFSLCASCFKVSGKPRPPRAPIDLRDHLTSDKIAN